MHLFRLIALHKVWRPAAASQKLFQLFMLDPGQDSWITDFVSIEVQYRQHGSVGNRVKKLVGLPRGR